MENLFVIPLPRAKIANKINIKRSSTRKQEAQLMLTNPRDTHLVVSQDHQT